MKLEILPMSERHLDSIEALERECFARPWTRESLAEELENENAHFLAAQSGGRVVGYIGIFEYYESCEIANVAVSADSRRQGVATALINAAAEAARERGCEFITLEVRESNSAARELYERLGFETAGRRRGFYSAPSEDGLIMTKTF